MAYNPGPEAFPLLLVTALRTEPCHYNSDQAHDVYECVSKTGEKDYDQGGVIYSL